MPCGPLANQTNGSPCADSCMSPIAGTEGLESWLRRTVALFGMEITDPIDTGSDVMPRSRLKRVLLPAGTVHHRYLLRAADNGKMQPPDVCAT